MTDKKQPAQFDWATELSDAQGHVTLSAQEAKEIGARLRSMGEKLKVYEDLGDAADDMQLLRRAQENVALLADILNRRPAMNAGLTQAYAAWTAEVYALMGAMAAEPANPRHQERRPAWR